MLKKIPITFVALMPLLSPVVAAQQNNSGSGTPIQQFMQTWAIPLLTLVLIIVTGYYAWETRGILAETRKLADETRKLADFTFGSYKVLVAPEMEFHRTDTLVAAPGNTVVAFIVVNTGKYYFKVVGIDGIRRDLQSNSVTPAHENQNLIIPSNGRETLSIGCGSGEQLEKITIDVESIAGERNRVAVIPFSQVTSN